MIHITEEEHVIHITEVECCRRDHFSPEEVERSSCEEEWHPADFCLGCGYLLGPERLYLEVHGPDGWTPGTRQVPPEQPYVCLECMPDTILRKLREPWSRKEGGQ